ncbi:hypothetical protein PsorP6_013246 [Peronosclerospora sorghi]|uniref:Uncharacterized protein n=1 Tax=Peronosclerospora sorghi TaxID=230839 RepID=A0ACC0WHA5_9STRA|nr:hypothetical protein PsorP6_013246 [Peronosclerospora sorghi]
MRHAMRGQDEAGPVHDENSVDTSEQRQEAATASMSIKYDHVVPVQWIATAITTLRLAGEAGVAEASFRLGVLDRPHVRQEIAGITSHRPHDMLACLTQAAALHPFLDVPGDRVVPHEGVAAAENERGACDRDGLPV